MILRLLNPQGIAGLVAAVTLGLLLAIQKVETRHWRKQSGQFEQLYQGERAALVGTVSNYRAAAEQARAADRVNAERVAAEQRSISERTSNEFEARLAAVRSLAQRLRNEIPGTATDPRAGRAAPVPGLSVAASGATQAAGQSGLFAQEAVTATEQAIQLDELIKWVRAQAEVDNNAPSVTSPPGD
jgi:hypothetical protein